VPVLQLAVYCEEEGVDAFSTSALNVDGGELHHARQFYVRMMNARCLLSRQHVGHESQSGHDDEEYFILASSLLTPWSRVLLEKLAGSQLSRNSPYFVETEVLLPYLQVPATCPYPEPDQSSPFSPSQFLKIHLNIILPSTPGSSKWSLPLRFPPPRSCIHLSFPP